MVSAKNFSSSQHIYAANEESCELGILAAAANVFKWSFEGGHNKCALLPGGVTTTLVCHVKVDPLLGCCSPPRLSLPPPARV